MYNVTWYKDIRGNCLVENFIKDLNARAGNDKSARNLLKKFIYCEALLKEVGTRAGKKFTKQISGKLWELRVDDRRVFFCMGKGNEIVLLHPFYKDQNRTFPLEINQAQSEMDDWVARNG